jgi:caspase domain-containing protein/Sel1 repeat-containing protein
MRSRPSSGSARPPPKITRLPSTGSGTCTQGGLGVTKDEAKAVEWYRKAAAQGDTAAQAGLGFMYDHGLGVAKDKAKSREWYQKAAANIAPLFRKGDEPAQEVTKDETKAFAPVAPPLPPVVTAAPPSTAQRRALVIGNTKYPGSPLRNPGNDAKAMATFLAKEAGFQVYQGRALLDLDRSTLVNALSDFAESLRRDDIVVFYFSGHGLERQGQNYLIPINFAAQNTAQLPYEAPTAQDIQKQLLAGEPSTLIMILDACRDLPETFKSLRGRAGSRGLGSMNAVPSTTAQQVIMFATAPGTVASDGDTLGNGTFTYCFLRTFQQPGLDSRVAFGEVAQCVLDHTNREQSPFLVTSQRQKFVFK